MCVLVINVSTNSIDPHILPSFIDLNRRVAEFLLGKGRESGLQSASNSRGASYMTVSEDNCSRLKNAWFS
jgi:hypothetical protein